MDAASHIAMMQAVQPFVDTAISKTVNVPRALSFEDFKAVYDEAYDLGLKGCTTFRPNEITGSVLTPAVVLRGDGDEPHLPLDAPPPPMSRKVTCRPAAEKAVMRTCPDTMR